MDSRVSRIHRGEAKSVRNLPNSPLDETIKRVQDSVYQKLSLRVFRTRSWRPRPPVVSMGCGYCVLHLSPRKTSVVTNRDRDRFFSVNSPLFVCRYWLTFPSILSFFLVRILLCSCPVSTENGGDRFPMLSKVLKGQSVGPPSKTLLSCKRGSEKGT